MPAPKGNRNSVVNWVGQFEPATEPKVKIDTKVPQSIAEEFISLLEPGESKSSALVIAIKLLIKERSRKLKKRTSI